MWWPGMIGRERAGSETMAGMSEKQVEQFLEYLRNRIDQMTKERERLSPSQDWETASRVKTERAEAKWIEGAFCRILEGRQP